MSNNSQPSEVAAGHAYVTMEDADQWFAARAIDSWALVGETPRRGALLRASEWIDGYFRFRGYPENPNQPRAWPRVDVMAAGTTMPAPPAVIEATLELAAALLDGENSAEQMLGARGAIRGERIGTMSVSYATPASGQRNRLSQLLSPYLAAQSMSRIVRS